MVWPKHRRRIDPLGAITLKTRFSGYPESIEEGMGIAEVLACFDRYERR